jgi:hypothetical protein
MKIKQKPQEIGMLNANRIKVGNLNDLIDFVSNKIDYIDRFIFEQDNQIINLKVDKIGDLATIYLQLNNNLFELFQLIFKDGKWQSIDHIDDDDITNY